MPPKFILEPSKLDPDTIVAGPEDIRKYNPHRYEMEQINAIVHYDEAARIAAARRDIGDDEFWVRGHIPGRPIFPGVLMCECAAQTSSYYYMRSTGFDGFLGFGGLQDAKFRGTVTPGDRMIMVAQARDIRARRAVFDCQGLVSGRVVFQCVVLGMAV